MLGLSCKDAVIRKRSYLPRWLQSQNVPTEKEKSISMPEMPYPGFRDRRNDFREKPHALAYVVLGDLSHGNLEEGRFHALSATATWHYVIPRHLAHGAQDPTRYAKQGYVVSPPVNCPGR